MNYADSTQVAVGDHIWWNEGVCVGFVCAVVESGEDQNVWGFDKPHVLLSGHHPYDPGDPGYIAYPSSDFEEEGVARLTSAEEEEFKRAVSLVCTEEGFAQPFHVGVDIPSEEDGHWIFSAHKRGEFCEFARIRRKK